MKKLTLLVLIALLSPSLYATEKNWMVRLRTINIMPDVSSDDADLHITNRSVPEVDFSYFFNKSVALEVILATATHDVNIVSGAGANTSLGSVNLLPPTFLAQYHFEMENFKPYVGAGVNYTIFYNPQSGGAAKIAYDNDFGYAVQIGADYKVAENLYLNIDLKKIMLASDVKITNPDVKTEVSIDPLVVGLGIGLKF